MYNIGSFNLAPFNTNSGVERRIHRSRAMGEVVESLIGQQYVLGRTRQINERINGSFDTSVILPRKRVAHEEVHAVTEVQLIGWHSRTAKEGLQGDFNLGKYLHQSRKLNDSLEGGIHIGKYAYISRHAMEEVDGQSHVGKHMHVKRTMHEDVHSLMRMALQRYQQFFVDAVIPPGAEIRINSNDFTVFLVHNGQTTNLRPRFTGDWVHFDRGTQRLYVQNQGTQMLAGDVLYNNRWL